MTVDFEVGSLEWWLRRLDARLAARAIPMREYDDYYTGDQPLALASVKFAQAFGDRFPHLSANFMELIVDAHRERLHVQGIRIGDEKEGDDEAWEWWQRQRLDAASQVLHTEALVMGTAAVMVWPNEDGEPEATIESPLEVVVEAEPSKPSHRRAALKRYVGEDRRWHAELYLPDGVYKFVTKQKANTTDSSRPTKIAKWEREELPTEDWPIANRLGVVPIVPFVNRPRLGPSDALRERRDGRSDLAGVMSSQDAINKLRADAIIASEFAAYPQRFMIGIDVPVDPVTKEPIDAVRASVMQLWLLQASDPAGDPEAARPQVGQFDAASLEPYYKGIESEMQSMATISGTPYHYFLQHGGQPPSGESLRSAEVRLIAKVRDSMMFKGDAWEEVFRLNFAWRDDARAKIASYETLWRPPEYQTESEHVDALVKLRSLGVPLEVIFEKLPASPQEIKRWKVMMQEEELEAALRAPEIPPPPATTASPALSLVPGGQQGG